VRDLHLRRIKTADLRAKSVVLSLALMLLPPLHGQFVVKLQGQTVNEFDRYAQSVEAQLNERWQGKKNFLALEDDPAGKQKVLAGEFSIRELPNGHPIDVKDGLVHDWIGAVYIPHTSMERVLEVLRDFDRHKKIYPEVADSRTVRQNGNDVTGFWRLQRKGLVPVVLDVEQSAHYQQVSPEKWTCRAYARNIREIDTGLFTHGRKFPPGEGHGYLWRLYAYWSLESFRGGVLGECRTLSLSRDIPNGLAWAVGPYVQKTPYESLLSTLRETRKAANQ
jgi:hypothetical protein